MGYYAVDAQAFLRMRRVIVTLFCVIPLLLLILVWLQPWVPPSYAMRDPLAVAAQLSGTDMPCCSRYLGAISTVGLMLWSSSAAICIVGAIIASLLKAERIRIVLLALAGIISTWLLLDDAFMLHEGYGGKLFGRIDLLQLLPVILILPLLGVILLSHSFTSLGVLIGALFFLAASLIVDDFLPQNDNVIFFEDVLKFFGIGFWTAYFLLKAIEFTLVASGRMFPLKE